jgi:hypothetical protein
MCESQPATPSPAAEREEAALRVIRDALRELQFGSVTAVVQDGVVVQVERTEKHRLARKRQKID